MKRIILAFVFMLAFTGLTFAQTSPAKTDKKKTTTTTSTVSAGPKKKDGTADMRYKANKDAAKKPATTHLKKDGTPDKRFKENKPAKTTPAK
ncbi:MAG TPA: hypothetical protein VK787_14055 [Puia sp.]|jgi:hypothetical protein|nr:hypothetical protein [Puia sp.]